MASKLLLIDDATGATLADLSVGSAYSLRAVDDAGTVIAAAKLSIVDVTPPPPPPPPPPPIDVGPTLDGVLVPAGRPFAPAMLAAKPGDKIYLERGGDYPAMVGVGGTIPRGLTLAAWGDASKPRPRILSTGSSGLYLWCVDGFTLRSIAIVGNGKPASSSAGLDFWGVRNLLVTDCEITGHRMGATVQPAKDRKPGEVSFTGNWIHDNCPEAAGADGSGLFADGCTSIGLFRNVFDRNGWSDTYAGSRRNHNVYLTGANGPAAVIGNVFSRASSHGLQARSGGIVEGNVFLDNPIHASFGKVNGGGPIVVGGVSGRLKDNLVVGSRPCVGDLLGWGFEISNVGPAGVAISGNRFAKDAPAYDPKLGNFPAAIKFDTCDLTADHADRAKVLGVSAVTMNGNAATWPFGPAWAHPSIKLERSFAMQWDAWAAVDVAAARAEAVARMNALLGL